MLPLFTAVFPSFVSLIVGRGLPMFAVFSLVTDVRLHRFLAYRSPFVVCSALFFFGSPLVVSLGPPFPSPFLSPLNWQKLGVASSFIPFHGTRYTIRLGCGRPATSHLVPSAQWQVLIKRTTTKSSLSSYSTNRTLIVTSLIVPFYRRKLCVIN